MKQLLLIDVDENLTNEECFTEEECLNATPNHEWIDWVNERFEEDFIVICTARRHKLYMATIEWLEKNRIHFHATSFQSKPPGTIVDKNAINNINMEKK